MMTEAGSTSRRGNRKRLAIATALIAVLALLLLVFYGNRAANLDSHLSKERELDGMPADQHEAASSEELTVLEQLLARDWPEDQLYVASDQEPPSSREEFINAASRGTQDVRAVMLSRAVESPRNELGQFVVLANHRFFNISAPSESGDPVSEVYASSIFLHYPGVSTEMEAPVARLIQYELDRERGGLPASFVVPLTTFENGLVVAIPDLQGAEGGWMLHVETFNELQLGPRRYMLVLPETEIGNDA